MNVIKFHMATADTHRMKISEEQVRKALEYLQTPEGSISSRDTSGISPDVLERAISVVQSTPDVRDDRVDSALEMLDGAGPSADEVAQKMIGRIISDSIR